MAEEDGDGGEDEGGGEAVVAALRAEEIDNRTREATNGVVQPAPRFQTPN